LLALIYCAFYQIDQLQRDIREKDILIHQKTSKMKQISEDLAQKSHEVNILRRSVENLREQVRRLISKLGLFALRNPHNSGLVVEFIHMFCSVFVRR